MLLARTTSVTTMRPPPSPSSRRSVSMLRRSFMDTDTLLRQPLCTKTVWVNPCLSLDALEERTEWMFKPRIFVSAVGTSA